MDFVNSKIGKQGIGQPLQAAEAHSTCQGTIGDNITKSIGTRKDAGKLSQGKI